jgi:hypothetical protein
VESSVYRYPKKTSNVLFFENRKRKNVSNEKEDRFLSQSLLQTRQVIQEFKKS